MDILRDEVVKKTRKPHRRFGCLKIIPAGDSAHVQVNTDCGSVGSIYTHLHCGTIMAEIWDTDDMRGDDTLEEGCVTQYLRDIDFDGTPEEYVVHQ